MRVFLILCTVLIGGYWILMAALLPWRSDCGKGWPRWLTITASCLLVLGGAGFFGAALSALGGLNWLPTRFEWPVGYTGGVVSSAEGLHVVPHDPTGRIQVYDAK
jgi:hypothetical protein